ncbi:MAG: DNA-3-methyladenine glycosylase [Nitrososphaerota archaeon]
MNGRRLGPSFYDRDAVELAKSLLGKVLVRGGDAPSKRCRIVEVEAYVRGDPANHAYRGMTPRNRSMFGKPGTLYVYMVHNNHCMNVVRGGGEAVLIRSAEPLENIDGPTVGPGRLCRTLGVDRGLDGMDLCTSTSMWLEDDGYVVGDIVAARRVGVTRGRRRLLRFYIRGSRWVSRR